MLREEVQKLVEHSALSEEAALLIILYLEEAGLSLDGNSWLNDDSRWQALLEGKDMEKLEERLETILIR